MKKLKIMRKIIEKEEYLYKRDFSERECDGKET